MNDEQEKRYALECAKVDLEKLNLAFPHMIDAFIFTKNLSIGPSNQAVYTAAYQAFGLIKQRISELEEFISEKESEK